MEKDKEGGTEGGREESRSFEEMNRRRSKKMAHEHVVGHVCHLRKIDRPPQKSVLGRTHIDPPQITQYFSYFIFHTVHDLNICN
jgi:hypothetical protein